MSTSFGLPDGTTQAALTVTDDGGDSASDTVAITVVPPSSPWPAAPSDLVLDITATGKGNTRVVSAVDLRWTDNADNEGGFRVERCPLTVASDTGCGPTTGPATPPIPMPRTPEWR